jgi:hypothetical protein
MGSGLLTAQADFLNQSAKRGLFAPRVIPCRSVEDVAMKDKAQDKLELDQLLHPAQAFDHPSQVVADPDLTLNEKRAILASWASDACAVEASPEFRRGPKHLVRFEEIMDALRHLDRTAGGSPDLKRLERKRRLGGLRRDNGSSSNHPAQ